MIRVYMAKPWLEIGVGYVAGRLINFVELSGGNSDERVVLRDFLAGDHGRATCHACPEIGEKHFRRRHTLAAFIKRHRHCGLMKKTGDTTCRSK